MYLCIYLCICPGIYASNYASMWLCAWCIYAPIYVAIYASMWPCIYVSVYLSLHLKQIHKNQKYNKQKTTPPRLCPPPGSAENLVPESAATRISSPGLSGWDSSATSSEHMATCHRMKKNQIAPLIAKCCRKQNHANEKFKVNQMIIQKHQKQMKIYAQPMRNFRGWMHPDSSSLFCHQSCLPDSWWLASSIGQK